MKNLISKTTWQSLLLLANVTLLTGIVTPANAQTDSTALPANRPETTAPELQPLDQPGPLGVGSQARIRQLPTSQTSERPSTNPSKSLNQDRIDAIHNQISLIKELMEKNEQPNVVENQDPAAALPSVLDQLNQIQPSPHSETIPDEPTADPESNRPVAIQPQVSGTPVVAHPINPFKLANSLFLTGNIEASRKSYEASLADANTEEVLWLKCFIGCCFRLEGKFDKAESTFREVTNDRSSAYPVDYAKWCLKYLEQRRNSLTQFAAIDAEIEHVLNEMEKKNGN